MYSITRHKNRVKGLRTHSQLGAGVVFVAGPTLSGTRSLMLHAGSQDRFTLEGLFDTSHVFGGGITVTLAESQNT